MKKKCLALLTVAATMSVASTSFAAMAGANTVNSAAIVNGQVMTADLANGAVTANQLAAGAVTDAKIAGPISTSKLNVGTAAGTVAAGNHDHDGLYQKKYGNVVVVAKSGGDYTDPAAAIMSITDASATNPYLVKIMPGVYDIGINAINMKSFVDVEGSGEDTTKIFGTGQIVMWGADGAELSHVTLENSNGFYALVNSVGSPKISHVTAMSTSNMSYTVANENSSAIFSDVTVISRGVGPTSTIMGVYNSGGAPTFNNLKVDVSGTEYSYGIVNQYAPSVFRNIAVTVSGAYSHAIWCNGDQTLPQTMIIDGATINGAASGLYDDTGMVQVTNSKISAPNAVGSSGLGRGIKTSIANTMINGGISGVNLKCVSLYDGNFDALSCP